MATVYKVEVVSHWVDYTKEQMQKILNKAAKDIDKKTGNEIQFHVKERK